MKDDDIIAGLYITLHEDGDLTYNSNARHRKDLLWCIEKIKHELMQGYRDDS